MDEKWPVTEIKKRQRNGSANRTVIIILTESKLKKLKIFSHKSRQKFVFVGDNVRIQLFFRFCHGTVSLPIQSKLRFRCVTVTKPFRFRYMTVALLLHVRCVTVAKLLQQGYVLNRNRYRYRNRCNNLTVAITVTNK